MGKIIYPLEQVLEVKRKRVEEAEKVVKEKEKILEKEKETLKKKEEERDKVLKHHDEKLAQLRHTLDSGTTSDEVIGMKNYLKIVKERVAAEEKKVQDQVKVVQGAQKIVDDAKLKLKQLRLNVDKFVAHKKDWMALRIKEQEIIEERELDELGQVTYMTHHKKNKRG